MVRLVLMASMLVSLIMSAVISESYTDKSLIFAGMYVLIQLGRSLWGTFVLRGHNLMWTYLRLSVWLSCTGTMWLVGGALGGTTRNVLWTTAIMIEYISVSFGNYVPGLSRAVSTDWDIHGGHLAGMAFMLGRKGFFSV